MHSLQKHKALIEDHQNLKIQGMFKIITFLHVNMCERTNFILENIFQLSLLKSSCATALIVLKKCIVSFENFTLDELYSV